MSVVVNGDFVDVDGSAVVIVAVAVVSVSAVVNGAVAVVDGPAVVLVAVCAVVVVVVVDGPVVVDDVVVGYGFFTMIT